jgi:uncharacterized protein (DUF2252 family)
MPQLPEMAPPSASGASSDHGGDRRPAASRRSYVSPATRAEHGKEARKATPRARHGEWEPAAERADPVDLLEQQSASRVPELVPIRYGRMLVSPFTFFRGAAYIMAADLAAVPHTGLRTQLSGDAHLGNFGIFAAPDRRLVFGANDFDETLPGPFEWDVKRLVTSFIVAGRERGFSDRTRRDIALATARSYRLAMRQFAYAPILDVWYARLEVDEITARWGREVRAEELQRIERSIARRRAKDHLDAFERLTEIIDGEPRIVNDPPLVVPIEQLVAAAELEQVEELIRSVFRTYRRTLADDRRALLERFRFAHVARKVVGVGSVGTRCWIVLLLGHHGDDPLFLQIKEAQASVLEPFLGRSQFANHGRRVVEGQRLTQAAVDTMLGWTRSQDIDGGGEVRDYYVRQLWDGKAHANVERMDARVMGVYGEICGWSLAHSHARSGDPIAIGSYLGSGESFERALARFAERYADQNERDFDAVAQAARTRRIPVTSGL